MALSPLMAVMQGAARKAARHLLRDFGEIENLQISRKGPADFVSSADKKAEEIIFENLRRDRPGFGFILEEGGIAKGTDKQNVFIVDPLDGTTNFLHGIPHFAISIALQREGELIAGLVYNPAVDEMFYAEKGKGAYLDAQRAMGEIRLRGAHRDIFNEGVFATGMPFLGKPGHAQFLKGLHKVMAQTAGVRRYGSAALDLAWTAAGRYDGYWERGLKPWDVAAGIVIAREAGLKVWELDNPAQDITGHDPLGGNIITANEHMIGELKACVEGG